MTRGLRGGRTTGGARARDAVLGQSSRLGEHQGAGRGWYRNRWRILVEVHCQAARDRIRGESVGRILVGATQDSRRIHGLRVGGGSRYPVLQATHYRGGRRRDRDAMVAEPTSCCSTMMA